MKGQLRRREGESCPEKRRGSRLEEKFLIWQKRKNQFINQEVEERGKGRGKGNRKGLVRVKGKKNDGGGKNGTKVGRGGKF